jgi:hypothetical protein
LIKGACTEVIGLDDCTGPFMGLKAIGRDTVIAHVPKNGYNVFTNRKIVYYR